LTTPSRTAAERSPVAALIARLWHAGVIPAVQLSNSALAVPLADALAAGGLPVIEVTFRALGAARAIEAIRAARPGVLVGAGSVLSVDQADSALDAGAQFIVSPGTNGRIVDHVLSRGGLMFPGVASPSEIEANLDRGLRRLKLFPAETVGGVAFLRAMAGPYPDVQFLPTGGVSAANLGEYLALPNVLACAGTWIAPVRLLEASALSAVEEAAKEAVSIVLAIRAPGESVTSDVA
jgi:2-dehydro-3-deoxyphosphogluconate aldolase / (4S)-4-hydroxy-2-oxoglutarate aldolase